MAFFIRVLGYRIGWLMLIYSILRLGFWIYNKNNLAINITTTHFLHGLRFDFSALCMINAIFVLIDIALKYFQNLSIKNKIYMGVNYFWVIINLAFVLINLADFEYFKYTGKRTQADILGIISDVLNQGTSLAIKFWPILIALGLFAWFLINIKKAYSLYFNDLYTKLTFKSFSTDFLLLVVLLLGIRGGLQTKPLRPSHAFVTPGQEGYLVLNSSFTFLKTIGKRTLERVNFIAEKDFNLRQNDSLYARMATETPQNVVIIIVESLAREYIGNPKSKTGYTPFLDSLEKKSISFNNSFAVGRESIDAVPAILASIPRLMPEAFITSNYQSNTFVGIGSILNKKNYQTIFAHSATNGSMGFDNFSKQAGIQQYIGMNEYPNKADFDGQWGIFDEPFLQFLAKKNYKTPFFETIFTISSHMPYTIPNQLKNKFPKGFLPIHESIGYADYALKKYFETAQNQPWFANTLFIITGDHTQQSADKKFQNQWGRYQVPIFLYHPNAEKSAILAKKINTDRIVNHCDIAPSILDFLNISYQSLAPFGQSWFGPNTGQSFHYSNNAFHFYNEKVTVSYQNSIWHNDNPQQNNNDAQWILQRYTNGLIDNNWTKP